MTTTARVTTTGTSLNGGEPSAPAAEESELTLAGTAGDIRFRIHTAGPADEQLLTNLARAQMDKTRNC